LGRKKLISGIVFTLHNNKPEAYQTKPILSVIDEFPVVFEEQLMLWEWIAGYYQCSLGEVYKAALPSGLKLESETRIFFNPEFEAESKLSDKSQLILDFLSDKKYSTINEINTASGLKDCYPVIRKLIDLKAVFANEQLSASYQPKNEPYLFLHPSQLADENLRLTFDALERSQNNCKD
jgi:primosomal protein N' (replication factor Y) (superfamily II helicase)